LYGHLTDTAITALAATGVDALPPDAAVGRLENTRSPISPFQVREWVNTPGTTVIVKPVIDLAGHVPVDSYEIPDRLKEVVRLRDRHCRFPFCTRPAEQCDVDHARSHAEGGPTCTCNLFPQCRGHHRCKTFSDWRYVIIDPTTLLWITPHGRHFLVDHRGTRALDPPRRLDPPTMDVEHDWETDTGTYRPEPCPGSRDVDTSSFVPHDGSRQSARATRSTTGEQPDLFTDPPDQ
jgi:hypothetical protein